MLRFSKTADLRSRLLCRLAALTLITLQIELTAAADAGVAGELPFVEGERLTYSLSWGAINVGSAVLHVVEITEWEGEPCWHFSLSVRTNTVADAIYRVRSSFDSYVSMDLSRTLYYRKTQKEGDTDREVEVLFDWEAGSAQYVKHERGQSTREEPITLNGPVHDPLGAVYYYRSQALEPGSEFLIRATDGKKVVEMQVGINETDLVRVDAGRFLSYLVEPETRDLSGVFRKSEGSQIQIWLNRAAPHVPVRVRGEVKVGSFYADLDSIRRDPPNREAAE